MFIREIFAPVYLMLLCLFIGSLFDKPVLSLFDLRQAQDEREDEGLVRAGDEGFNTNSTGSSRVIRALVSVGNWKLAESLKLGLR